MAELEGICKKIDFFLHENSAKKSNSAKIIKWCKKNFQMVQKTILHYLKKLIKSAKFLNSANFFLNCAENEVVQTTYFCSFDRFLHNLKVFLHYFTILHYFNAKKLIAL